jgi:DNA repair protein RadC
MARAQVREKSVLASWQALIDYLTIDMAHLTVERVRVLYLNAQNMLIHDDHVGDGSIAEAGRLLLGIAVHDHVIIGREGQVSLKAKGLI